MRRIEIEKERWGRGGEREMRRRMHEGETEEESRKEKKA